jgi:KUP system potassium uptake protein
MQRQVVIEQAFGGDIANREHVIAVFRGHVENVWRAIPRERLLVYQVTDGWAPLCRFLVFGGFLVIDLAYFAANALKIPSGGWFPLVVAAAFAYLVVTWRRGRAVLWDKLYGRQPAVAAFIAGLDPGLIRVRGTAVYMTGNPEVVPTALMHNIEHNQVLHEIAVLMTVRTEDTPYIPEERRVEVARLDAGFFRVVVSYGFMDQPDVPRALELCRPRGLRADPRAGAHPL